AHKKGQAKRTAKSITGGYTASCNVNVLVPAVSISLNKNELVLDKGVSETLYYEFEPAESTDSVSWSSTNTSVATVSSTGKVTAVKPGEAVIIATTNRGKTATCHVTVYSYIKTISFSKSERKVFVGKTVKLEPTITPSDYTDALLWSSDNTSVVSVDNKGNITTKSISGTANITVTNNKGKSAKQKIIVTDTIQDNDVTLDSINCEYSPDGAKPNITVKVGDDILEENVDYTIECSDNTELGSATVVIKNKKNENNSIQKEFNVVKHNIASDDIRVSLDQTDATYTGKEIVRQPTISLNGKALQRDVDYSFICRNNVSVGNAIVTITGMGNYEGSINYTFKIVQCNLSRVYVKENKDKYYDGTVQMPQITLEYNGKTLVEGVDYTLPSISNKNVGSYTVSLSGKGNFNGNKTIVYRIVQPDEKAYVIALDRDSWTYTGDWIQPKVTITFNNKDVTSQFSIYYSNNEDVGIATVSAFGYIGGKYSELTKDFRITPKPVKLRISGVNSWYRYTGYSIEPDFECILPDGYLAEGTVTYLNNRNVGTATVVFKCTGNYSGTIKKSFSIIPSVNSTLTLYRFAKKKLSVKSSAKVSFKSSNKKVATVKSNGTVYGKKKGTCYVSVTSNGKTVRVKVTVKKVSLNKKKIKVYKGYSKKLKVKGYKKKVKWSSSNPRVAKVNKKGKVTGINPGKATITAKIGKTKLKCKVRVKKIAEVQLTDFGYIINYVNGVEPWFTFKNNTSKTIKYITTTLYAYNRVGDPAKCEITGVNHATLKFVGPIKKHKSRYYEKSAVIYNGTTGKIKIRKITVQFMDGTTKTYSMKRSA
ncbi:MAG: Ig-like domain-containing protein, partial [Eubacterium sp.]|nr:Ig-like domain-containing protein [Eubacterium sp.]